MGDRGRRALLAGLGAVLVAFPWVFVQPYPRDVMIRIFLYALLAQAWNLLGGYCGQVSLGSAVFFGIGAYTSSVLSLWWGVSPWLGMLAGMALAVLVSQAIGYPCFRLRGHYFAIATIGIGEIVQTVAINWDAIGGARGIWLPIKPETLVNFQFHRAKWAYYYVALALLAAVFGLTAVIERSRLGYYFRAIREDPDAAESLGVPLTRYKLLAIAASAAFTALGGTFYAQYVLFIDPGVRLPDVALHPDLPGRGARGRRDALGTGARGGRARLPVRDDPRLARWHRQGGRPHDLRRSHRPRLGLPAGRSDGAPGRFGRRRRAARRPRRRSSCPRAPG